MQVHVQGMGKPNIFMHVAHYPGVLPNLDIVFHISGDGGNGPNCMTNGNTAKRANTTSDLLHAKNSPPTAYQQVFSLPTPLLASSHSHPLPASGGMSETGGDV